MTGSARAAREAQDKAEASAHRQEVERKRRELERKRTLFHAEMEALQARFESQQEDLQKSIDQEEAREAALKRDRAYMASIRKAEVFPESEGKDQKGGSE